MRNEAIPDWAIAEADKAVEGTMAQASPLFIGRVSKALVAAERRGRDAGIAAIQSVIEDLPSHDPAVCLDMAIRKLMEQSDGE